MAAERLGRLRPTVTIPYPENEKKKYWFGFHLQKRWDVKRVMRSKKKLWTCHEIKKLFFSKPSPSSHPTRPKHHKFTNKWALQNVFVTNFFSPFVASKIEFVICKNFKIAIVPVLHLRWNHSYYFLMRSWRQWPPLDVRPLRMRIFARIQTLSFCILPVWKKVKQEG